MTKLDLLNQLLKDPSLKLPSHRNHVEQSGSNLPWLKKHLSKKEGINTKLKELLALSLNQLLTEIAFDTDEPSTSWASGDTPSFISYEFAPGSGVITEPPKKEWDGYTEIVSVTVEDH
jgi:hypothetical protein